MLILSIRRPRTRSLRMAMARLLSCSHRLFPVRSLSWYGAMIRSALFQKVTTLVTSASLALAALAPTAISQPALPPKAKADSAKTPAPLFTTKDFVVAGAFAVGTVAMFPLDERLA